LDVGVEHAFDLDEFIVCCFVCVWWEIIQVVCQEELIFQFGGGTHGVVEESGEVLFRVPTATFRDIGWNRRSGPTHLTDKSIAFGFGKALCDPVNIQSKPMRPNPNLQFPKISHPTKQTKAKNPTTKT
jgi:hypothetical protein